MKVFYYLLIALFLYACNSSAPVENRTESVSEKNVAAQAIAYTDVDERLIEGITFNNIRFDTFELIKNTKGIKLSVLADAQSSLFKDNKVYYIDLACFT